jgi:hypothetical protein
MLYLMNKEFISQEHVQIELSKDEVVMGNGSNSKTNEDKKNPKWLIKGHSESDMMDRNFEKRITRSQSSILNFALMAKVMKMDDPDNYAEASKKKEWNEAMEVEFNALVKNDTWDLVKLPKGKDVIGTKWVYKTKYNSDGSIDKHKAHLVSKGYAQKEGIDYTKTFAPVAKLDTIRMVLALVAQYKWIICQMDVKSTFLNGYVDEEIYVEQPKGFEIPGKEDRVYRLKKALYGLKQAPRAWYSRIDKYFQDHGLVKSSSEPNLYILQSGQDILIVALYVDDLIYTGNNFDLFQKFKSHMIVEFEMTDLGELHYFLGIEVWQKEDSIFMSQAKYTWDILKKFNMLSCKPATTPLEVGLKLYGHDDSNPVDVTLYRQLVGSLIYLTTTRPDISFAVNMVSRFMSEPKELHWKAIKRILRYCVV